jgi:N,N'-diacetyllegionaminate synthase
MQKSVKIIAEIGVNHNGNIEQAFSLIDAAATAGADYVKFQYFEAKKIVTKTAPKAAYQIAADSKSVSQFDMLKNLELSHSELKKLCKYSKDRRIKFLCSAFDTDGIKKILDFDPDYIKIPSGEITNLPYLLYTASIGRPLILSTGMSTLEEINEALVIIESAGLSRKKIIILHCNSEYPTPYEDVNLHAMKTIKNKLQVDVGYSDHTKGIEVAIAAIAMGATVLEKHLTLDKQMKGPDHFASIEPFEFTQMVKAIRNIEKALGSRKKFPSQSEIKNREIVRKSIVARKDIKVGEQFTIENITTKRPGTGISAINWEQVLGLKATLAYKPDELINEKLN